VEGGGQKKIKRKRSSSGPGNGSQNRGPDSGINYEKLLKHREKRTAAKENQNKQ
jgi:hypothetical protein